MASSIPHRLQKPSSTSPRIAVVQFYPKFCAVEENIQTARRLCAQLKPHSVDLVCLSEMVFTGYIFKDAAAIKPFLEEPQKGPTSLFCAELATKLKCHVVAGYPERLKLAEIGPGTDHIGNSVTKLGANSAIFYGPDGRFVGNYRKTNLFDVDTTWAKPGTGFATFQLPPPLNTVSLGVCMDLNVQVPGSWTSLEDGPYEMAEYCLSQKADLVILLNAWLEAPTAQDEDEYAWDTLNYWAHRLRPLWALKRTMDIEGVSPYTLETAGSGMENKPIGVVICNRTGEENGKLFCGSSSLFRMERGSGRPKLIQAMKKDEEGVRIWTI